MYINSTPSLDGQDSRQTHYTNATVIACKATTAKQKAHTKPCPTTAAPAHAHPLPVPLQQAPAKHKLALLGMQCSRTTSYLINWPRLRPVATHTTTKSHKAGTHTQHCPQCSWHLPQPCQHCNQQPQPFKCDHCSRHLRKQVPA
jgi:hypothetical protein